MGALYKNHLKGFQERVLNRAAIGESPTKYSGHTTTKSSSVGNPDVQYLSTCSDVFFTLELAL